MTRLTWEQRHQQDVKAARENRRNTPNQPSVFADSHAGLHGDVKVFWWEPKDKVFWRESMSKTLWLDSIGWYWGSRSGRKSTGPFETSQAAFGDYKDKCDKRK